METSARDMPELELALLRRGVDELAAGCERCRHCQRTPLIGERVYIYDGGRMLCELCRALEHHPPVSTRIVHGPEFGHTMRISDHRAAAARTGVVLAADVAPRPTTAAVAAIQSAAWSPSPSRRR